jgi:probable rRNA maturation factor
MANINVVGVFKKSGLTQKDLKNVVETVFFIVKNAKLATRKNINIAFVEAGDIQKKNLEYRKIDKPTDVLSFDYGDEGDILLCLDLIREMKETSEELSEAVQKTIAHGTLHLFGYDHENEKDRAIMEKMENKVWGKIVK